MSDHVMSDEDAAYVDGANEIADLVAEIRAELERIRARIAQLEAEEQD